MRTTPEQRIDDRALRVWRWHGAIASLFTWAATGGLAWCAIRFDWPLWIAAVAIALAAMETVLTVVLIPQLSWQRWRYEVRETEIDLQRGIWFVKRTVVPMVRVQHVDTKQGPIMRKYGLATVTFSTAAGSHEIPALAESVADPLRERIAELARLSHEDI